MNYRVESISLFDKQAKWLAKKFPSLKKEIAELIEILQTTPKTGTPLGNGFFKIHLAIGSKGRGKSGGARVITFLKITGETIYLSAIYDKSEHISITDKELKSIFQLIP